MSRLDIPRANDNTLNFVFPGGIKPSWKGNKWWNRTYGSAVPTSSQPQTNLSVNTGTDCSLNGWTTPCYDRSFRGLPNSRASGIYHGNRGNRGPLNPIKHWRKQLQPSQGHVTGKVSLNNVMWTPGGSAKSNNSTLCCGFNQSITFDGQTSLAGQAVAGGGVISSQNYIGYINPSIMSPSVPAFPIAISQPEIYVAGYSFPVLMIGTAVTNNRPIYFIVGTPSICLTEPGAASGSVCNPFLAPGSWSITLLRPNPVLPATPSSATMVATVAGGGGSSVVIAGGAQFQAAALVVSTNTPGYSDALLILNDQIGGGTATLIVNGPAACPCQPNIQTYLPINFVDPRCCPDSSFNILRNELSNFQPVAINNPARRPRPRSSQTLVKKNYYTTGSAYLKARVKLYEQNQLLSSVRTNQGGANFPWPGMPPAGNNYVYPISQADNNGLPDTIGTQAFYSTYCCATDISGSQTCCGVFVGADASCGTAPDCRRIPITFKPSNPFFSVQGAVDSSTRILQKRYAAITQNNFDFSKPAENSPRQDSLLVPYDATAARRGYVSWFTPTVRLPGSTPTTYRGITSAPYFIKSNYQALNGTASSIKLTRVGARMPSGGTGIRTVCYSCGPP